MEVFVKVQQPEATELVKGWKNVIHIEGWQPKRGDIIVIYATDLVISDDLSPLEFRQDVINQQQYGNMPPDGELPVNALIGLVKVLCETDRRMNAWTRDEENIYHVVNALEFDSPLRLPFDICSRLTDVKDKLPSHRCSNYSPHISQGAIELFLPLSKENFDKASNGGTITLEYAGHIKTILEDYMDDFEVLTVNCNRQAKSFFFNAEILEERDESLTGLKKYPSALDPSGVTTRKWVQFSCRYPKIFVD